MNCSRLETNSDNSGGEQEIKKISKMRDKNGKSRKDEGAVKKREFFYELIREATLFGVVKERQLSGKGA